METQPRRSILFVCTGNTCRSVFAEAFARRRFGSSIDVASAGIRPQPPDDARNALETLASEFGIVVTDHVPRDVTSLDLNGFSAIVALGTDVARWLKKVTSHKIVVWRVDDPWVDIAEDPMAYKRCALRVKKLVLTL